MFYVCQRVAKQNGEVMQQTDYPLSNLIVNEEEWDPSRWGKGQGIGFIHKPNIRCM